MFVAASKHMCVCVVGWGYACLCTWVLWCWYKNALSCQVLYGLLHHLMIFAGLWQMPNVSAFIIMDTYTCPPAFFACPSWDESFLLSFHWCWFSKTKPKVSKCAALTGFFLEFVLLSSQLASGSPHRVSTLQIIWLLYFALSQNNRSSIR